MAFTGETVTGRLIMSYAAQNLIPSTTELGGKSPNIFFEDVMAADDAFLDKAIEGLVLYAFNKGEVCTCPSRALIHESIYDAFMERCLERIGAIKQGDPLDRETMIGPQVSVAQLEKIEGYVKIGRDEGAEVLIGGQRPALDDHLAGGYYFEPTVLKGHNKMRVFQEEIFGPVLAVTTFKDEAEALEIANDTMYGLGAGVWTRDGSRAFRMGRAIKAGRVWTNCYHHYPAHAAFGGYKSSGVGRENHQDDARPLLADEVPARQLRPQADGFLLIMDPPSRPSSRDGGGRNGNPGGPRGDSSPRGHPGAADVLPVGGVLRWHLANLPEGRRASGWAPRPAPGGHWRSAVLHRL